jgi:branched-subunit amino acid transport protein
VSLGFWLSVLAVSAGSVLYRLIFLARARPLIPPPWLKRAMEFLPPAVLAALVFPEFLGGDLPLSPRIIAGLCALALAWAFNKDLLTIGSGLLAYWLISG